MNKSMSAKLAQLARRLQEIDVALAQPDAARDMDHFRRLSRERADIEPVVPRYHDYASVPRRLETLESDLQRLLLPVDPNDDRNIFLEIRAGTGGEESALFAAELLRMYMRYAERQRWQTEMIS